MSSPRAKILFWDIETRSLVADYGSIFTIGWKFEGEKKAHVKTIHDIPGKHPLDDSALVKWFSENVWDKADIAVGWYSEGHDEPFIRSRLIIHGDKAPKPVTSLDMWKKVYKRFKFSKNSLDNITRQLNLGNKYYGPREDFEKVLYGDKQAMARIAKHNRVDVEITERAYERFKTFFTIHPRTTHNLRECRVCGSTNLQRRGWAFSSAKGRAIRVSCKDCGAWDTKLPREIGLTAEEVKAWK